MKKLLFLILVIIISCSKTEISGPEYSLINMNYLESFQGNWSSGSYYLWIDSLSVTINFDHFVTCDTIIEDGDTSTQIIIPFSYNLDSELYNCGDSIIYHGYIYSLTDFGISFILEERNGYWPFYYIFSGDTLILNPNQSGFLTNIKFVKK